MDGTGDGIWVRLLLTNESVVMGFAAGADSPNDFWIKFRTQLVKLDRAKEIRTSGEEREHETVYVNRDRIAMVEIVEGPG